MSFNSKNCYLLFFLTTLIFGTDLELYEKYWAAIDVTSVFAKQDSLSRKKVREYVVSQGYKSILDVPCGLGTDYLEMRKLSTIIEYYGIDITQNFVDYCKKLGMNTTQGSINDIPFLNSSVDVVYCRHILEHLNYYEKAISEVIRVAHKEAIIIFFIKPVNNKETIEYHFLNFYNNQYDKRKMERYIFSHKKVDFLYWEHISDKEVILYITLKD